MHWKKMWREVRKRGWYLHRHEPESYRCKTETVPRKQWYQFEFMLLLDQGTMDKEAVEDLFDISSEQLACVNGAEPGMGLIRFGDKIVPFDNTMEKRTAVCTGYLIRIFMRW